MENLRWIPVSEMLPKEYEIVLTWVRYKKMEDFAIGWRSDKGWYSVGHSGKAECLAWMPLPEPYEEAKI